MGLKKVSISEVSLFHGLQELFLGKEKVSLLERCPLNCMQELFLGKETVFLLERCPHFRGVLRERVSSICTVVSYNTSVPMKVGLM